ncbi:receptor-like protein kinase FERONIA [Tanacetum coccineum]
MSSSTSTKPCFRLTLAEIQSATRDFDKDLVIREGGFGKVYKGCICVEETSHVVAIKRRDPMFSQSEPEFRTEIEMLSKLCHCHLVSLIGFCDDNKEMILVYEYMPYGTLHDHLHTANTPLSWVQRLEIAIRAARGLDYLHTGVGTHYEVIHRDVKSSNILLDDDCAAMIADFGLSKIGPTNQSVSYIDASIKGTFGYLDPEYFYTIQLARKIDVFAFGVVLFELLLGRLPVSIRYGTIALKCLRRFAQTAYCCLHNVPKERPTMTKVVASLQGLPELQKKYDLSTKSPSIINFHWKIQKNVVSTTKLKMFTYSELKCATSDFGSDRLLGEGSYGKHVKGGGGGGGGGCYGGERGESEGCVWKWVLKRGVAQLPLATKDFTAKLSGYDITMLVDGHYPSYDNGSDIGDYYPWFYPFELQSNLSSFEVIFAEVLTGEQISNPNELWTLDRLFIESGKES